jgi:hypothetical protein
MPSLTLFLVPALAIAGVLLAASHERACTLLLIDNERVTRLLLASLSVKDRVLVLGGGNVSDAVLHAYRDLFHESPAIVPADSLYTGTSARGQQIDRILYLGRNLYDTNLATDFANSFIAASGTRLLRDGGTVTVVGVMGASELQQWFASLCGAQGMYLLSNVSVPAVVPHTLVHSVLRTARYILARAINTISVCTDPQVQHAENTLQLRVLTFRKQSGIHTPSACLRQARVH